MIPDLGIMLDNRPRIDYSVLANNRIHVHKGHVVNKGPHFEIPVNHGASGLDSQDRRPGGNQALE
jgi:hypothetical protein